MNDKDKLAVLLRAFKAGQVTFGYSIGFILSVYRNSKRFNSNSFSIGVVIGLFVMYMFTKLVTL